MKKVLFPHQTLRLVYAVISILVCASIAIATDSAELEKQIKKLQSSVDRRIATEPQTAEKEWFEAQSLINDLKTADPSNKQLSGFETTLSTLKTKLEKRLKRPVGQTDEKGQEAAPEPKKSSASPVSAESTKPALSSAVLNYLKKINTALDSVEDGIEKFRLQTAKRKMADAKKDMDEMLNRHGNKIPDDNEEVQATKKRLEAVSTAYDTAQAEEDARIAAEEEKKRKQEAQSNEWLERMSPFFNYNSPMYLRYGSSFNTATEEEQVEFRKAYDKAIELMAEYEKTEFPYGKTYQLAGEEMRLSELVLNYKEEQVRDKRDEACKKWIDAFRAYVSTGSGSDKFLVRSPMFGKDHVNRQAELLEEAKVVWAEYRKAEFPLGKNPTLIGLEKEMAEAIEEMPEIIRQCKALISDEIEEEFDRVLAQLEKDTGWTTDKTKMPNIAMKRDLDSLSGALDEYSATVKPDDAKLVSLNKKLEMIRKKDQENRAVCAERRYMRAWQYTGSDGTDIENSATAILKKAYPKAKILRTTLPHTEWKEERVLEYTDSTQTAVRYRITRYMTVDVAAKDEDGKVYLHIIHVASDRTSSGNWGELYGHVKWSDWMIEENVTKKAPTS
ncbi:MAG: hypothetical protein RBU23_10915 [Candidatus Auribacterota bacterium]|jgi:ParB-like chromosome segregation protein Spo0J|nr:hypothetical protein [Candidatus Auribacterota bacterium]